MDDSMPSLKGSETSNSAEATSSATPPGVLQDLGAAPEVVAAIIAAISAHLNISATQFTISSLKPVASQCNSSFWTIAGRQRLIGQRQDFAILRRRNN